MVQVAIGGFMGVGKSTVGTRVAAELRVPFVDTDAVLIERFGSITRQFTAVGEAGFRRRERAVVAEFCDGQERVLATGGGVFADPRCRAMLGREYVLVTLTASLGAIRARIGTGEGRPLSDQLEALYEVRKVPYGRVDFVVDTDGLTIDQVAREVVACVG
jgi:shikimate kinase